MTEAVERQEYVEEGAAAAAAERRSADDILKSYMDGEVDLYQTADIVKFTADVALNAKVDALLAGGRYASVIQLLGKPATHDNAATEALYEICQLDDAKLRHLAVLISKGADPNFQPGTHALSPLHIVSERHWYQAVAYLSLLGADSNSHDTSLQQTPLMLAVQNTPPKHSLKDRRAVLKTVKKLLKTGQRTIDHVDDNGFTALDYAFNNSLVWVVKTLVTAGATVLLSNLYALLQSGRKECTLLSTFFIDYNSSDAWVHAQLLIYGAEKVCRGLVQFKMRMELRTSEKTRAVQTAKEDQLDLYMRDPTVRPPVKSSVEEETPKEVLESLAEQRRMRRQKSRADKAQIRHNKEQNKLEKEQEQKKLQFLKRVEKEYKVSFQGLFPR